MRRRLRRGCGMLMALGALLGVATAQAAPPAALPDAPPVAPQSNQHPPLGLTWEQVKERLELNNPTLLAGKLNISEFKADEITAHLRPNPNLALLSDQIDPFNVGPDHGPFAYWLPSATISYLHERAHKKERRSQSQSRTIWSADCCSTCGARSCKRCRRRRCCRFRSRIWSTTITC
jgi:hypothetical protein